MRRQEHRNRLNGAASSRRVSHTPRCPSSDPPDHLHDMKTRGLNSCSRRTGTQLSTCIDVLVEVRTRSLTRLADLAVRQALPLARRAHWLSPVAIASRQVAQVSSNGPSAQEPARPSSRPPASARSQECRPRQGQRRRQDLVDASRAPGVQAADSSSLGTQAVALQVGGQGSQVAASTLSPCSQRSSPRAQDRPPRSQSDVLIVHCCSAVHTIAVHTTHDRESLDAV